MNDLTFSHTFSTGRTIVLSVKRTPDQRPEVKSSLNCADMSAAELAEYEPWRTITIWRLMSILTPGEVFATNQWQAKMN